MSSVWMNVHRLALDKYRISFHCGDGTCSEKAGLARDGFYVRTCTRFAVTTTCAEKDDGLHRYLTLVLRKRWAGCEREGNYSY